MMLRTTSVNTFFFARTNHLRDISIFRDKENILYVRKRETSSTPVNTLSCNLGCFLVYEEKAADIWGAIN